MRKAVLLLAAIVVVSISFFSCNNPMSGRGGETSNRRAVDRSQRTVIDTSEYIDFTAPERDARTYDKRRMAQVLGGRTFWNGNSYIRINASNNTIEIASDRGSFNGRDNLQVFGSFGFEIRAASEDFVYIRRDPRREGILIVGHNSFRNDQIPDIAVCIPLYGYSRNRIEVSSIMDGFIIMPSGTYWHRQ